MIMQSNHSLATTYMLNAKPDIIRCQTMAVTNGREGSKPSLSSKWGAESCQTNRKILD